MCGVLGLRTSKAGLRGPLRLSTEVRPRHRVCGAGLPPTEMSRVSEHLIPKWYRERKALTVRTDTTLEVALTSLSKVEGISQREIIGRAVLERYERSGHVARVTESIKNMVARWGDDLERLGSE